MLYHNIPIVLNGFSESDYTKSIFIEFSKAFNTDHYIILLAKLVSEALVENKSWLQNYLNNCKQSVAFPNRRFGRH